MRQRREIKTEILRSTARKLQVLKPSLKLVGLVGLAWRQRCHFSFVLVQGGIDL